MTVCVTFTVNKSTSDGELVFVVGNDARLGLWNPSKAIQLSTNDSSQWTCQVNLDSNTSYSYRYFIGKSRPNQSLKSDIVQWETHQKPRHFDTGVEKSLSLPDTNFGDCGGIYSVGKGWLTDWSEVHIRLYNNPITASKSVNNRSIWRVQCIPVDYSHTQHTQDDSIKGAAPCASTDVLVSNINSKKCRPAPQNSDGITFNKDDFIVFRHRTPCLQQLGFQLDIFACEDSGVSSFLGSAHLLPDNYPESQHVLHLPVIGPLGKPVGIVNADLLIARPTKDMTFDMEHCHQSYRDWRKSDQKPLDIGHRGMGASYSVDNIYKENTVASFQAALRWGADLIETDVLLSQDSCPIIFHDFSVFTALRNKQSCSSSKELHDMPVMDLTLEDMQSKKFYSSKGKEINDEAVPLSKSDPFPTLAEILTDVDEQLGFNLEVKYPQMTVDDQMEADNYTDMNAFLDTILKTLFQHANGRRIVFSTFQPDICVLLNLKQNKYPVMFLSQGRTNLYTHYKDFRADTFQNAINFALSEEILGLVLHTEVLLQDLGVIDQVLRNKLILFVWGDHNNNTDMICQMRECKVDGVIYDRMDLYKPENKNNLLSNNDGGNQGNDVTNGQRPMTRDHSDLSPKKKAKH